MIEISKEDMELEVQAYTAAIEALKTAKQRLEEAEAEIRAAEVRGAAFAIMVVDQLHIGNIPLVGEDTDRIYKHVKNTIRLQFEAKTGIDPAPNYPVPVASAMLTEPKQ